jgi:hypothetical protein
MSGSFGYGITTVTLCGRQSQEDSMLHLAHKVIGAEVLGTDGSSGELDDFYIDADRWTVRYLVVGAGTWLGGTRVLISPLSVRGE